MCFDHSFVHPSSRRFYLSPLALLPSLRLHLPRSSRLSSSILASPPPISLVHCLPIFVSSFALAVFLSVLASIPGTLPPHSPSLPVRFSPLLPASLAPSRPHPKYSSTNYISLVRCVSHWGDFDFSFTSTIIFILLLSSET